MSRKNEYLQRMEDFRRAAQEATRETFTQYLTDCAAIALHRMGWGEKRIRDFIDVWGTVYDEFFDSLRDVAETDYYRQKLDESLLPLCKTEPLTPFEVRYKYLPEMRY